MCFSSSSRVDWNLTVRPSGVRDLFVRYNVPLRWRFSVKDRQGVAVDAACVNYGAGTGGAAETGHLSSEDMSPHH